MMPAGYHQYLPLLIVLVVAGLMARRMVRPRRFRVATAWIPLALIAVSAAAFFATRPPPSIIQAGELVSIFGLGLGLGYLRGRLVDISIDPATGVATQCGTPLGLVFIVALFVLRGSVRIAAMQHPEWGLDVNTLTEFLIPLALGMLTGYPLVLRQAYRRAITAQPAADATPA